MKNAEKVILECYKELFANSTPSADFEELVANASLNEQGQKVIPFTDYEIEEEVFDKLVNRVLDKHKVNKLDRTKVMTHLYLGCSPKFKRND